MPLGECTFWGGGGVKIKRPQQTQDHDWLPSSEVKGPFELPVAHWHFLNEPGLQLPGLSKTLGGVVAA